MFSVHKAIVARIFAAVVALDLFHNDMIQCKVDTSKTHRAVQNKRYYILVAKPVKFRRGTWVFLREHISLQRMLS